MAGEPITREEMIAMFGESMPMEAVQLAWNADGTKTVGEIRDELRALAKRTKARRDDMDIVERLGWQYDEWNNPPSPELPEGAGILLEAKIEIACIRADNARLRAALQNIESETHGLGMSRQIARDALESK